jgi:hypothetical protein
LVDEAIDNPFKNKAEKRRGASAINQMFLEGYTYLPRGAQVSGVYIKCSSTMIGTAFTILTKQ